MTLRRPLRGLATRSWTPKWSVPLPRQRWPLRSILRHRRMTAFCPKCRSTLAYWAKRSAAAYFAGPEGTRPRVNEVEQRVARAGKVAHVSTDEHRRTEDAGALRLPRKVNDAGAWIWIAPGVYVRYAITKRGRRSLAFVLGALAERQLRRTTGQMPKNDAETAATRPRDQELDSEVVSAFTAAEMASPFDFEAQEDDRF